MEEHLYHHDLLYELESLDHLSEADMKKKVTVNRIGVPVIVFSMYYSVLNPTFILLHLPSKSKRDWEMTPSRSSSLDPHVICRSLHSYSRHSGNSRPCTCSGTSAHVQELSCSAP